MNEDEVRGKEENRVGTDERQRKEKKTHRSVKQRRLTSQVNYMLILCLTSEVTQPSSQTNYLFKARGKFYFMVRQNKDF